MISIKTPREIELCGAAAGIVANVLELMGEMAQPGVTTAEMDAEAEAMARKLGGEPLWKGYRGYPAMICTSINEQVVHGIPGPRELRDGDIVSVDVGVRYKGYCGDAARTLPVGKAAPEALKLLKVTEDSLMVAVAAAVPGGRLSDVSHAIQTVAEGAGFSVVRDYVGPGIGSAMHEEPQIPNFGPPGAGPKLRPGMVLAIEPMINAGGWQVRLLDDGWTVVTADGSLSAHFEHEIAITEDGPKVLSVVDGATEV